MKVCYKKQQKGFTDRFICAILNKKNEKGGGLMSAIRK